MSVVKTGTRQVGNVCVVRFGVGSSGVGRWGLMRRSDVGGPCDRTRRLRPGYGLSAHRYMAGRTAPVAGDFFVDHLQKGMRVLDCGCGAGPITIGLAEIVSPGEVVGIDQEFAQVGRARALAAEQSAPNVRFDVGDLFVLSFADA